MLINFELRNIGHGYRPSGREHIEIVAVNIKHVRHDNVVFPQKDFKNIPKICLAEI